jgi:ATP-dependent DNA ligase
MAFLYAFDLLELDGQDLRREPLEAQGNAGQHSAQG